jgi:gas vesicle protein
MNNAGKIITGFLAGASLGILTGILIAPSSGRKTRKKLFDKSRELKDKINGSMDEVRKSYNKKVDSYARDSKSGIDSIKQNLKV